MLTFVLIFILVVGGESVEIKFGDVDKDMCTVDKQISIKYNKNTTIRCGASYNDSLLFKEAPSTVVLDRANVVCL